MEHTVSLIPLDIDISHLNTPAGFSDLEVDAITFGIQDWMNQPNNARVTFNMVLTTTPPPVPTAQNPATHQMAVVRYVDVPSASAVAETQTTSMGQYVFNNMTFYRNIRSGALGLCFVSLRLLPHTKQATLSGLPMQMTVQLEAR